VQGGEVLAAVDSHVGTSLLEQVAQVEALLDGANDRVTLPGSFSERLVRLLPPRAAREAVLNGVVHRDWHLGEATTVTWVEADTSLEVVSPGGFVGGVNASNVLTQRYSRSPALADAVRALGLVDKQGIGVDRMYREMVTLGHRPPLLVEEPGPRVRVRLTGGRPVVPVMRLVDQIEPRERQSDVRVALIVHTLLHEPFITARRAAEVLQRTGVEAEEALHVAGSCVVDGVPLIEPYRDVWVLSRASTELTRRAAGDLAALKRLGVLTYLRPDAVEATRLVRKWLAVHDRISSGDYATLSELTHAGARRALERMAGDGLLERGETAGRNAHFLPAGVIRSGAGGSDPATGVG
jgi:ATP-dependent DNA helicase RecG